MQNYRFCGEVRNTNLAMKLWDPVPLSLVKPHGGPHALIATVIATCPTWSTGTQREELLRARTGADTGQRVEFSYLTDNRYKQTFFIAT